MTINDILIAMEDRISEMSNDELVPLWNSIFPKEEKISKKDIAGNPSLTEEVSSMIMDEIENFSTIKILNTYNRLMGDGLTLEDLDQDTTATEEEREME
jgi:hypothetical protein